MEDAEPSGGPPRRGARFWLLYAAAWVPFILIYALLIALDGASLAGALAGSAFSIVPVALLGVLVFRVGERLDASVGRGRFVAAHVLLAFGFAAAWCGIVIGGMLMAAPRDALERFLRVGVGWQFLSGLMLYAVIAGVETAMRTARLLRVREAAAARSEALRVRAELQALRAQLDPHFLFNTLHTVLGLVRREPREAEHALEQFGDLLRYVLDANRDNLDEVAVADEIGFVRHYLALERLRLGDRLRVVEEIDPDSLDVAIPSFTLQPLVENAVRHGIAPRRAGGTLTIVSTLVDDRLRLEVRDDGEGAPAASASTSTGIGLRVVRQRLEARYGSAAYMELSTAPDAGFVVAVELPAATPRRREGAAFAVPTASTR